ncbi:MAG: SpoVA/SpoVAEb family sporulation membrane protein [Erysipelotrichaceae bacterium]|nr:SpoVA/SpoVAEb family sporulation membrane protein [Erysipelotrichaceae bacterium]
MKNKIYNQILDNEQIKRPIIKNSIKAFIIGGLICAFGELLIMLFNKGFKLDLDTSKMLMSFVLVLITAILTGFGVFDKIGEVAGAGTIVPITGFANSLTASALESKSEGIITGILTNMFKLAGAVIATAIISAFIIGSIIYFVRV